MNIKLTKSELRRLLDMIYMAEWMLNAHKTEKDPRTVPYGAVEQKVLAVAHRSGQFEEFIEYDAENDTYWHTRAFDDALYEQGFIEEYDNDSFWDELANRMAVRDAVKKVGGADRLASLPFEERMRQIFEREAHYSEEFHKRGIERLYVRKTERPFRPSSGKSKLH